MSAHSREIVEIPARNSESQDRPKRQLRVAAYCRVSTNQESQQNSYQTQKVYYTDKIASNPDWILVDIFADEGITGTSAQKRPEFQRMIRYCQQGKVDLILTKSISRFARNTLDCLYYVRLLQGLQIPVIFEAENIDTSKMDSEFLLAMLGANSQAESEATSSRIKWGVRAGFREGKVRYYYKHWLGYQKGEDGTPQIIPDEASIVRQIFADYLAGQSLRSIKASLERQGIPTKAGNANWTIRGIQGILTNEKYTGDVLLQKTYTTDPITKQQKKNDGVLPQYLIKNCHPAIISHETYNAVQAEIRRRTAARQVEKTLESSDSAKPKPTYSQKYALSEILVCSECNTLYRRCIWKRRGKTRVVWRCRNRLTYGVKYCKHSPTLDENALHKALAQAINSFLYRPEYLLAPFAQPHDFDTCPPAKSMPELYQNLKALQQKIDAEITDIIAKSADSQSWDGHTGEISSLLEQRKEYEKYIEGLHLEQYAPEVSHNFFLPCCLDTYSDTVARMVLDTVKVLDEKHLLVIFKGGAILEQSLE